MNIFVTKEKTDYRRWVNVLLSLIIPGSAQYLSGRKKIGIIWFIASFFLCGMFLVLIGTSNAFNAEKTSYWLSAVQILFVIGLVTDACRRPMPRQGIKKLLLFLAVVLSLIMIPVLLIRQFLITHFSVPTGAMQPTIMGITADSDGNKLPGDRIIVNRTAYWKHPPQRGDIVVFKTKNIPSIKKNTYYVKRVAGLPGETVSINPPNLLINGEPVKTPEIFGTISESRSGYHGYVLGHADVPDAVLTASTESVTLDVDEYFVLGDNSLISFDSRYFGPIPESSIIGKVVYLYFPPQRKGKLE